MRLTESSVLVFLAVGLAGTAMSEESIRVASPPFSTHQFGVGVSLENGTGVSVYSEYDSAHFLQGAVGWSNGGAYSITGDFAFGYQGAWGTPYLTPFWGGGLIVSHADNRWPADWEDRSGYSTGAGLRIPLGLNFMIPRTPVQLSGEIVPTVFVTPATYSYIQGGLAARVLF